MGFKLEFRHGVQIFFLFLILILVGAVCSIKMWSLYVSCPLGVLQAMSATGVFLLGAVISSLFLIFLALFAGRFFCSWICPVGTITEHTGRVFPKTQKGLPNRAKNIKYGFLAAVILAAAVFKYAMFCVICPIGVTCRTTSFQGLLLAPELLLVGGIILAEAYERRAWCKHLCPVGALFALISKVKVLNLKINTEKCISCSKCIKECKNNQMDVIAIEAFQTGVIDNNECNFCLECVELCPKDAIEVVGLKERNALARSKKFQVPQVEQN